MTNHVEEIKDKLPVEDVVSGYIKLDRAGKYLRARCPFHTEKTASFVVTPERGMWHCFGCGKGGDIFAFVQEIEHVDFKEALAVLAQKAGVTLGVRGQGSGAEESRTKILYEILETATKFFEVSLRKDGKIAVDYLLSRGITKESIVHFRIGFAPDSWDALLQTLRRKGFKDVDIDAAGLLVKRQANPVSTDGTPDPQGGFRGGYDRFRKRIMFPIANSQGKIIAFTGRVLPGADEKEGGKYVNSPETALFKKSKTLYGYDRAKDAMMKQSRAVLVEGQMDLVLAHQAGTTETVALSGTAATEDHMKMITRFTDTLVLALDRDPAGIKASARTVAIAYAGGLSVQAIVLPDGKDPADVIAESPSVWQELVSARKDYLALRTESLSASNAKEKLAIIQSELFPLIAYYSTDLLRDEKLSLLSHVTGYSLDALRGDFAQYVAMVKKSSPASVSRPTVGRDTKTFLLDQISALVSYSDDSVCTDMVRTSIDSIEQAGFWENAFAERQPRIHALVTEATMVYSSLSDEVKRVLVKELLSRYEIATLEEQLHTLLIALQNAESAQDSDSARRFLADIATVSKHLDTLKESLHRPLASNR